MRLNFKKVSAIAASALMVGMSMGVAAAANYPNPFVVSGAANVAIVYGTGAGVSSLDVVQAGNIESNLQSYMTGSTSTSVSTTGETAPLFSDATKLYISNGINKVKTSLTKTDLPTILADGSFSGNVQATYTQMVQMGVYPNITYGKQPTSSSDPTLALVQGTSASSQATYNETIIFNKAVNFSNSDSIGQDIVLFGNPYTISASTDNTNLVLLQSAQKVDLKLDTSSGSAVSPDAKATVTINGAQYTIELISGSDTSSTVKVTDSTGASETKTITEAKSSTVNGISVAVITSTAAGNIVTSSIVAGSNKMTFTDGSYVKTGDSDTAILGTYVSFNGATGTSISKLTVSVAAKDTDHDALLAGNTFVDPVFGTLQLNLAGFTGAPRENITVYPSGNDKMYVQFTDSRGNTANQRYAYYVASTGAGNNTLTVDDNHANLSIMEREKFHTNDMVVVGNEDTGRLLKLSSVFKSVTEGSTGSGDTCQFLDVLSGDTYSVTFTSNSSTIATGTFTAGGKTYTTYVEGLSSAITDYSKYNVSLDYPDSGTATQAILYPTIRTSQGSELAFYKPITFGYRTWYNQSNVGNPAADTGDISSVVTGQNLTGILFPNGANAYQTVTIGAYNASNVAMTCAGTTTSLNGTGTNCSITNTGLTYAIGFSNTTMALNVSLIKLDGTASQISGPAIVLFEGKDDSNTYNNVVIELSPNSLSSSSGIGVSDVERSWSNDGLWDSLTFSSVTTKTGEMDRWGTEAIIDSGDSAHVKAVVIYPKNQVTALAYMGSTGSSAIISGGNAGTQLGDVLVKDSEVSSVSAKNLIVVGGSCINSAAANLLGAPACTADFTTKTGIGSGQFLIQSFASPYSTGKVALLVAGYDAADTVNAATYLRTQTIDTTVGKKYQGTSATTATLVTTSA